MTGHQVGQPPERWLRLARRAAAARSCTWAYTAAKAALTAHSKGLAKQVGHHGLRVNVVLPGLIRTIAAADIPLARAGSAAEVAQLITFLAPAAGYLTGSQFTVDGGALPTT